MHEGAEQDAARPDAVTLQHQHLQTHRVVSQGRTEQLGFGLHLVKRGMADIQELKA